MTFLPAMLRLKASQVMRRTLIALAASTAAVGIVAGSALAAPVAYAKPEAAGLTAQDTLPVTVVINSVDPAVVKPGDDITVSVLLTNTSTEKVSGHADLTISRVLLLNRSMIGGWAGADSAAPIGNVLASENLELDPGKSQTVTFKTRSSALGLLNNTQGWGPRGIAVSVTGSKGSDYGRWGIYRSFILWQPVSDDVITPVSVGSVVPITGRIDQLAELTAPAGRLSRTLESVRGSAAATLAVDPTILLAASGDTSITSIPGVTVTSDAETMEFAKNLAMDASSHQVYGLPPFDQDIDVVGRSTRILEPSTSLSTAIDGMTKGWRSGLALPAQDAPSAQTLAAATTLGNDVVVARSGYEPLEDPGFSPGSAVQIPVAGKQVTVLAADPVLTALFTDSPDSTPITAHQRILAELAVISKERPAEARSLTIALPRSWDPEPAIAAAQFAALDGAAWATSTPISVIGGEISASKPMRAAPSDKSRKGSLSAAQWTRLTDQSAAVAEFAHIVAEPDSLSGPITDATLSAAGNAWHGDPRARQSLISAIGTQADKILDSQSVVIGSNVNLISAEGAIPITMRNNLDREVTVTVRLAPDDPRLSVKKAPQATIAANSETSVEVPVRAVGSGDVAVAVRLVGPNNSVIATPASFTVRVRAGWESVGTAIIAGGLALTLIAGIWRTIRRGRRASRTTSTADAA